MRISFSKQYRYVTNHLHVTNNNIFVFTVTNVLLTMCQSLVSVNTYSTQHLELLSYVSIGPMDLFYFELICTGMVGEYEDYGSSVRGHIYIYSMAGLFVQGHMPIR